VNFPPLTLNPVFNITRASHVVLGVRDLAKSKIFYCDMMGFVATAEENETLYLRGLEEGCHHSLTLRRSDEPGCMRLGMRVQTDADLEPLKAHFEKHGLPAEFVEVAHQKRTLHATDPVGTLLEFCASMETRPRLILKMKHHHGACPMRLDHYQVFTSDVPRALAFYMEMGFRVSEYIVRDNTDDLFMVFLHRKWNPHDIVFTESPGPRLHHIAFTSPESYHLFHLCDMAASFGFGDLVEYGPGRHFGPGYAQFVYIRDPDGHRIECFNNHYQTMDIEDEPVRFNMSDTYGPNVWGPDRPETRRKEGSPRK
jgi:catechol 2,3-dioxygenase